MKIAVFSDIHGNLAALEAAVADARKRGARRLYCAGDLTGYGPFPSEVIRYLDSKGIVTISGNYDKKVLGVEKSGSALKKKMKPRKWKILYQTSKLLKKKDRKAISKLPERHEETLTGGARLLMVHGGPSSDTDTIYPSITPAGLRRKLGEEQCDILVCGHTHIPFARKISNVLVVNCGSTGMPVDGDPRPTYALIDAGRSGRPSARIIRFVYDNEATAKAIPKSGMPRKLMKDFIEGNKKRETP
jgi:putative phosphoesterase